MAQKVARKSTPSRLTHLKVSAASKAGYMADGGGLYLRVLPSGTKQFVVRHSKSGARREEVLGVFPTLSLAAARKLAKGANDTQKAPPPKPEDAEGDRQGRGMTFDRCAAAFIKSKRAAWSASHATDWERTIRVYASPKIGAMHPSNIKIPHLMQILEPIWTTKTETATRVRSRVEAVLGWATVMGLRKGDNPARWKNNLSQVLADRSKVAPVSHHPALPFAEIPAFIAKLRASTDRAAPGLLFTILTATRSGEARGATWAEVDLDAAEWTIPAARMKGGREHRVPLPPPVVGLLAARPGPRTPDGLIFTGHRIGKATGGQLSHVSFSGAIKSIGYEGITTHGFRSTFRDWAAEKTEYANEVVEMALAHAIGSKVEAAYRRGNLLEKRRFLMVDWCNYCYSGLVNLEISK